MTQKISIIIGLLTIIISCNKGVKSFYDIEKLNSEVKKEVEIDLFELKSKIDSHYRTDSSFYSESIYEIGDGGESKFYKLLGLIQKTSNGDSITVDQVEPFKKKMLFALKKSIEKEKCNDTNDSTCVWKENIIIWINESTKERQVYLHYPQIADDFYGLYKKGYMNKKEFEFFTVFLFVLTSIDAVDNSRPNI